MYRGKNEIYIYLQDTLIWLPVTGRNSVGIKEVTNTDSL